MEGGSGNGSGDRALSGGHSSAWVALVTGGNRGIGLEICKQLASSGVMVVLTARDKRRGIEAVSALGSLGLSNVVFHQLEVSDPSSTARSADFIKDMFGKLDILLVHVNNAGIVGTTTQIGDPETFWHERTTEPYEKAEECLRTNYHGIKSVTKALLPLLLSSSHGRIVNLSSRYGQLRELNNIDNLSEKRLDELSELFLKDFKDGQLKPRGWPTDGGYSAYIVSKALLCISSAIVLTYLCILFCVRAEVAVVTGGNRGIGLEICKQLASSGVTVVLTARDVKKGAEAVSVLGTLGLSNIVFHQLDVGDPSSAAHLADFIKEKFGKLDILVNNAGISGTTSEVGNAETFRQEELNNINNLSEQRLDELSELFLKDFKDSQLARRGWPTEGGYIAYKVSKAIMNAYSRILAKEYPSLSINCVHPGYVQTDMNFNVGDLTVEEGARGALMMALAPRGGMTGGNRGIGLEVCKQLASNGITVVLTARDQKRGAEAVSILGELGLSNIVFHQLDVSDPSSAVNNAAISGTISDIGNPETFRQEVGGLDLTEKVDRIRKHSTEPYKQAEECLRTNYHGTKAVTKALLSLLQSSSHGRIVNISSRYGLLRFFSGDELKQELNNIDNLSEHRLDELSELFLKDFKDGQLEGRGWPTEGGFIAYKVSKAIMNAYSRILAKEYPSLCINCVHPGFVQTDMSFQVGDLSVKEGARGALMMALAPKGGMTGGLLNRTEPAPFV
ncbi:hypothetical protein HU200_007374 [Digitaria exilis]|uniref:Uncharacterized protein n=1 Tax=Digitaria exilis TaxID=1010633 RepID=A0A835FNR4_9POAL|nr:hypothetical protein HU200_007374 [Digitaria exilis]